MIGYVTVGTHDMARAAAFYDALFAPLGAKRIMALDDRIIFWGVARGRPAFAVCRPNDGGPHHRGKAT